MKKSILTTGLLLASMSFSVPHVAAEQASTESIKVFMEKTGAGDLGVQAMEQMLPALKRMVPDAPESFWNDFMTEVRPDDLVDMTIPIYQKYLSQADIEAIIKFYDSKAGKKLLSVQPQIMQESMAAGQAWGQGLAMKVMERYQAQQAQ